MEQQVIVIVVYPLTFFTKGLFEYRILVNGHSIYKKFNSKASLSQQVN